MRSSASAGKRPRQHADPESGKLHHPNGFVWSDQYDWRLQLVGTPWTSTRNNAHTFTDEAPADRFVTVYADDEDLVGAVAVNWPAASRSLRQGLHRRNRSRRGPGDGPCPDPLVTESGPAGE